ncbi:MAG: DinB family protein [Chloroflexi bacterium]|nr:MAG: DinB family protein [Chloroflexota bacterium]
METYRKSWNKKQTKFRKLLLSNQQHPEAMDMFFSQHAQLHSAQMVQTEPWSFADWVLDDMTEAQIRRIPHNCEHSVAWLLWHMARIEDTAINLLVAGTPQLFLQENWRQKINAPIQHTGNSMNAEEVVELSATIDIDSLLAYRLAVGHRTREIVQQLTSTALKQKVNPGRIQTVMDEGAIIDEAQGIADYWSKRTIAGLLLMPATRHNYVHLNEALKLKRRR